MLVLSDSSLDWLACSEERAEQKTILEPVIM